MPRRDAGSFVLISPSQAVAHCRQAEEYLRSAEAALDRGDFNAAAGTAVDAGINAADTVAGMNLGKRWKGPHDQAAAFVESAGIQGREVARELRRLIPLKNQAHYEPVAVSATRASGAVEAARRAVAVATRASARARM